MKPLGTFHETNERYELRFERFFPYSPEEVFRVITNPEAFTQWYPFATGEMELREGGTIAFDDGEGTTYEGVITALKKPHTFEFREVDDLLHISIKEEGKGSTMIFTHTFGDKEMVTYMAAGWHRCLDVLEEIIRGQPVEWKENAEELRKQYEKEW